MTKSAHEVCLLRLPRCLSVELGLGLLHDVLHLIHYTMFKKTEGFCGHFYAQNIQCQV